MSEQFKYEDIQQYLRTFSAGKTPYDFGGLLRLVQEGIESLRKNVADDDILEYAHLITDEQASFLQQLLDRRGESKEWLKNEITHSSQVLHGVNWIDPKDR